MLCSHLLFAGIEGDSLKILFLSFYYSPDLCAGSFRATALVQALKELRPDLQIDIVTTLPNRYSTFSAEAPREEHRDGVFIKRVSLPPHQSGMIDQSKAFLHYAKEVRAFVVNRDYDLVLGTSSRLMTAVLSSSVARSKKLPLYLDIRDIFVDTIKDVLPRMMVTFLLPVFSRIERYAMTRAEKINLVSQGFHSYFRARYPSKSYSFFTNGIDEEFLEAITPAEKTTKDQSSELTVLYAGNLGEGQGLHSILPELAQKTVGRLKFKVFGDGGRKQALVNKLSELGVRNVEIHNPIPRDKLIQEYLEADILFLHLNNYPAFEKVLPSKIFEYAAMGKPIWAGVPGYAAEFLKNEVTNVAVFPPCDPEGAIGPFNQLKIEQTNREAFVDRYSRKSVCQAMAQDILSVIS